MEKYLELEKLKDGDNISELLLAGWPGCYIVKKHIHSEAKLGPRYVPFGEDCRLGLGSLCCSDCGKEFGSTSACVYEKYLCRGCLLKRLKKQGLKEVIETKDFEVILHPFPNVHKTGCIEDSRAIDNILKLIKFQDKEKVHMVDLKVELYIKTKLTKLKA